MLKTVAKIRYRNCEWWYLGAEDVVPETGGLTEGLLTQARRFGMLVLGSSLLLGGLCGSALPRGAHSTVHSTPHPAASIPAVWKSETTKSEYRIQVSANSFTAVWTNIPKPMQQQGAYVRTECRRMGSKWIGTTRSYLPFSCGAGSAGHPPAVHWCHILTRTEISSIAPGRIEGRGEALKSFDCDHCRILQKEWKPFTWAPLAGR
ncbi:MAG TPA: hypothetical protein VMX16_16235 [Terriglobia bacterium]|nr:hypothetical protein [Terriglobia bacterium]